MIEWTQFITTDNGDYCIRDLCTRFLGRTSLDYAQRPYTVEPKTDRRINAHASAYRIITHKPLKVKNELDEWVDLEYIYYINSVPYVYDIFFYVKDLRAQGAASNEIVLSCIPRQKVLVYGQKTLEWKNVYEFDGIGKQQLKLHNLTPNGEYMGLKKVYRKTHMIGLKAKNSMGVQLRHGIVVLSAA